MPADRRTQPGLELVVVGDRRPPRGWCGQAPGQRIGDPAALLLDEHLLEVTQAATAHLDRHVGRGQAEPDGPRLETVRYVRGDLARMSLGVLLVGDQLVGEAPGSR